MYLILDTETTGIPDRNAAADLPSQPRVASVAMIFCDADLDVQHEWHGLIKPDGWSMPPHVEAINGLSNERLAAEGTTILYPLAMYGRAVDQGRIIVAHNVWFDAKMMRGELRRARMPDRYERTRTICTMRHGRPYCSRGSLAVVHQELCGKPLNGAHDALNDARGCLAVLRELRNRRDMDAMVHVGMAA